MTGELRDVVTTAERELEYIAGGLWDDSLLADRVAAHAAATPNAPAVRDDYGVVANYAQLDRDASRVATLLAELGVRPGDVVALQLPNWYASAAIAVGATRAGAVVNPMLPSYRERELRHMLRIAQTSVIFTPGRYRSFDNDRLAESLRAELPLLRHHLVVTPDLDALPGLADARDRQAASPRPASAVAELIFTSGTEAEPKAVMHTERTLNCNLRATWSALGMTPADSVWMPAPIGHSTGFNHGLRLALYFGLPLLLQDVWDAGRAAALVERHRPTHTLLSSTFLRDLVAAAGNGAGDVTSLRLFGCGGAIVPPELVDAAAGVGIQCLRLYGATEFLVATWVRPGSSDAHRTFTDGLPLPGVDVEVRDAAGRAVVGETGDIYVRSASNAVGLFRDPERTGATFVDGWIRSGDLGVLDTDGGLSLTGRRKEIIIRGGLNITPREIEEVVQVLPAVRTVVVAGVTDERLGEITCAFVVLEPGSSLAFDELAEHLQSQGLARFKWPQRLEIVAEMPTTATGKIRKHVLIEQLRTGTPSTQAAPASTNPSSV
ncbi:AMP-binding protein [Jatrophihabitans cynanchi]|uniref:AMP-binding protein n=1 Tax=Jatrophihabitans cynanchi TaxID=2944128 RepID=A0ABY7K395_9ACTN|nr:AMP-binding protein [Jatrophihabitans sp. SB3-54]WAX58470.1 AMP-binding protein [Jatrophihabitans sp. SB3-54]